MAACNIDSMLGAFQPVFRSRCAVMGQYKPADESVYAISIEVLDDREQHFEELNPELVYETRHVVISALDNTVGRVSPRCMGKVGDDGGDRIILPDDEREWRVRKIVRSNGAEHELLLIDADVLD